MSNIFDLGFFILDNIDKLSDEIQTGNKEAINFEEYLIDIPSIPNSLISSKVDFKEILENYNKSLKSGIRRQEIINSLSELYKKVC